MNWKNVVKGILKGIQIPIFSPIPLSEELLFNAFDEKKDQEWKVKIESLLMHIDKNTIANLEKLENSFQFIVFSQIPLMFSDKTKSELDTILKNLSNTNSQEEQNQIINEFWEQVMSNLSKLDIQMLNTKIEEYFETEKAEIEIIKKRLISLTPISKGLLDYINESINDCKTKNIPYQTPNLLLSLFQIHNSLLKQSFDKLENGLGDEYYKKIEYYVRFKQSLKLKGKFFKQFDWSETEWGQLSKIEAFNEGYPIVVEKFLLLGILQSKNSGTIKKIKEELGDKFPTLLTLIKEELPFKMEFTDISNL